MSGNWLSSS